MPFSISGLAGSGKDTVADILVKNYGYRKDHFAFDLKNIATKYLSWNGEKDEPGRRLLQHLGTEVGRAYQENIWLVKFSFRNGLDMPGGEKLRNFSQSMEERLSVLKRTLSSDDSTPTKKAMLLAQAEFGWDGRMDDLGQNLIANLERVASEYNATAWREKIDEEFWTRIIIEKAEQDLRNDHRLSYDKLIIPDCRFPNEMGILKLHNFISVKVYRPGVKAMGHISETALDGHAFDVVIDNVGTLAELGEKVKHLVDMDQRKKS